MATINPISFTLPQQQQRGSGQTNVFENAQLASVLGRQRPPINFADTAGRLAIQFALQQRGKQAREEEKLEASGFTDALKQAILTGGAAQDVNAQPDIFGGAETPDLDPRAAVRQALIGSKNQQAQNFGLEAEFEQMFGEDAEPADQFEDILDKNGQVVGKRNLTTNESSFFKRPKTFERFSREEKLKAGLRAEGDSGQDKADQVALETTAREEAKFVQGVAALMAPGDIDEATAQKIQSGRFMVSVNTANGNRMIVDKGTGDTIQVLPPAAQSEATPGPIPVTQPDVDVSAATGIEGKLKNVGNLISDAFGAGAAFPRALETTAALDALKLKSTGLLQEAIPGRPSVFLLEIISKNTVDPNEVFVGEARAGSKFQAMRNVVAEEINRMDGLDLANLKAATAQAITLNRSALNGLLEQYDNILVGMNLGPLPEGIPEGWKLVGTVEGSDFQVWEGPDGSQKVVE